MYLEDETYFKITSVKYHKNTVILKFKGINTIDEAQRLRQKVLYVPKSYFDDLPEGTYLIADIIGLEVFENEVSYGKITDCIQTGSNDVYVDSDSNKKEILIPALESVIEERRKYYTEDELYTLVASDVRNTSWLTEIKEETAFVIMEGISMYLQIEETQKLLKELGNHFKTVHLLVDVYTEFAAKASKVKNPINDVGVTDVTGIDDPMVLCNNTGFSFVAKCEMTPQYLVDELTGLEKGIFKTIYAGSIADKTYRLYEYVKK